MESICVSLEMAKKLKKAGWQHETYFGWYHRFKPNDGEWDCFLDDTDRSSNPANYPAPTASEIADVLPAYTEMGRITDDRWFADVQDRSQGLLVNAPTMADALAKLWLKLQENK